MQNASIKRHMKNQHPTMESQYTCRPTNTTTPSIIFRIQQIVKGQLSKCPVPGCSGGGTERFTMYRHFCYRHPEHDIVIEEDGM